MAAASRLKRGVPDPQDHLRGWIVRALPQGRGLPAGAWERRHRGLLAILWIHVAFVPLFGIAMGYGVGHSALEGMLLMAAALAAHTGRLGRRMRSTLCSVGLLTASGLLVHFSGGFIEFHFHFFVMIALLSLYVDWVPFSVAVAYVAAHHGVIGVLDPEAVYNHPDAVAQPWKWAGIHAAFVLAAGAANVFTWRISEEEALRRENVERVTEAALAKLPLDELLSELLRRVSETVGAELASLWLTGQDGLELRAVHGAEMPGTATCLSLEHGLHADVVARAEPVAVAEVEPGTLESELHRAAGARALAGAPLMVEGSLIGVLDVASRRPRRFSETDLGLLQLVADRIGPAIDRARLYEEEHQIASTLQRSLLPKRLPVVHGVDLAARYLPAGDAVAVGGDWYDAIELGSGRLAVVMGDVAGHGTEAASLMGQLRTAARAYATEGHSPATVVTRLNSLLAGLEDGSMATLLYLELDIPSGRATLVSAGHPPPLVRRRGGGVEYLETKPAAPLGARAHTVYAEHAVDIGAGSTIVLYTDGLVERPGESLDHGLDALVSRLGEAVLTTAEATCRDVLGPGEGPLRDDVAVLVVHLVDVPGRSLRGEYPSEVTAVSSARRDLERFLRTAGVPEMELQDLVLGCAEACSNAVQHAYGPEGGRFRIAAEIEAGVVRVTVSDDGTWRRFNEASGGGRGLPIMNAIVDDVDVSRTPQGTRVTLRKLVGEASDDRAA